MIIKRPIYNKDLKCVALELLANQDNSTNETVKNMLQSISQGVERDFPLFVPYAIKPNLEASNIEIINPLIYKLRATDIDTTYPREEIEQSPHAIALLIDKPDQLAWLNYAEYIALSEILMDGVNIDKVVKFTQEKNRKVIAYGLLHHLSFEKCRKMTMDFYCGDFIMQPNGKNSSNLAANKLNVLQLISTLQEADADFNIISDLISSDPLLSYQLLRIANSVAFSGLANIASIDQALVRLGVQNLKNWILVLSVHNISDKPIEVVESGLIRAKMTEKLAKGDKEITAGNIAYTAGLLTILDTLMEMPLESLINHINISDEIHEALLHGKGPLGQLLNLVIAYESGHWEEIESNAFNGHDISETYISCLDEVARSKAAMQGS